MLEHTILTCLTVLAVLASTTDSYPILCRWTFFSPQYNQPLDIYYDLENNDLVATITSTNVTFTAEDLLPCISKVLIDANNDNQSKRARDALLHITWNLLYIERPPQWSLNVIRQLHEQLAKAGIGDEISRAMAMLHAGRNDAIPIHLLKHTKYPGDACLGLFRLYIAAWYPVERTVGRNVVLLCADLCARAGLEQPSSYPIAMAGGMVSDKSASYVTTHQAARDRLWESKVHYARAQMIVNQAKKTSDSISIRRLPLPDTFEGRMPSMIKFRHPSFAKTRDPAKILNAIADYRLGYTLRAKTTALLVLSSAVQHGDDATAASETSLAMAHALLVSVLMLNTKNTNEKSNEDKTDIANAHAALFASVGDRRIANSHMIRITDHFTTYLSEEKAFFTKLMVGKSYWRQTFVLPEDAEHAIRHAHTRKSWWIKPLGSDLGRGHSITDARGLVELATNQDNHFLAQRHIEKPCLMTWLSGGGGQAQAPTRHKFSIRVFALVASWYPLVVYVSDKSGDITISGSPWKEEDDDIAGGSRTFDRTMHISNYRSKIPQPISIILSSSYRREDGSNDQKICGEKNPKDLWFGIKNILFDMFSTMSKSNVPFPKGNAWLPRLVAVDFTVDKGGEIWLHEIHWTAEPDMRLLGWVYDTYHQYLATGQLKNRNGGRIFDLLDNNLS